MSAGHWLAKERGVYDLGRKDLPGLDVQARLRQSHRAATIRPVPIRLDTARMRPRVLEQGKVTVGKIV